MNVKWLIAASISVNCMVVLTAGMAAYCLTAPQLTWPTRPPRFAREILRPFPAPWWVEDWQYAAGLADESVDRVWQYLPDGVCQLADCSAKESENGKQ